MTTAPALPRISHQEQEVAAGPISGPLAILQAISRGAVEKIQLDDLRPLEAQGLVALVPLSFLDFANFHHVQLETLDAFIESRRHRKQLRESTPVLGKLIVPECPQLLQQEIDHLRGLQDRLHRYAVHNDQYFEVGHSAVALTAKGRAIINSAGELPNTFVPGSPHWFAALERTEIDCQENWEQARAIAQVIRDQVDKALAPLVKAEASPTSQDLAKFTKIRISAESALHKIGIIKFNLAQNPRLFAGETAFETNFEAAIEPRELALGILTQEIQALFAEDAAAGWLHRQLSAANNRFIARFHRANALYSLLWVRVDGSEYLKIR